MMKADGTPQDVDEKLCCEAYGCGRTHDVKDHGTHATCGVCDWLGRNVINPKYHARNEAIRARRKS